ncbi:13313_t:CDS:2, partial [Gigaspora margarita]
MATLPSRIINRLREKPVVDTNRKYIIIYEKCWQGMQDNRPSIQEVAMDENELLLYKNMKNDLDELIKSHKIAKYDYYEFSKLEKIGRVAFGTVHKARRGNSTIALKNINKNDNTNQAKLQHLAKLGKHEHIIEFYGVTKGIRDSFTKSIFYEKCRNFDKTVIVLKVQGTGGDYNPLTWGKQNWKKFKETNVSFIIALNNKCISSIYSKVKHADYVVYCRKSSSLSFGYSDLYMHSKNVRIWRCCPHDYENPIKIIDNGSQKPQKVKPENFQIENYESARMTMKT